MVRKMVSIDPAPSQAWIKSLGADEHDQLFPEAASIDA
jgi:hypothetical protein